MPRLLSRTKWPPYGFCVLHPEAGMKEPFSGSFDEAVAFELAFRQRNKALAQKLGLPLDQASVEVWVDEYNARRCLAGGWPNFVASEVAAMPSYEAQKKTSLLGRVVEVARASRGGIGVWLAMFGPDGKPVEQAQADARAVVCSTCSENDKAGNLRDYVIAGVVQAITSVYEMMRDLTLQTPHDAKLGVCKVCICPLKAKVHCKLSHITKHMPEEVRAKLPGHCWILKET